MSMARPCTASASPCSSHRLNIDISLFTGWIPRFAIAAAMPIFLFINGLEDRLAFSHRREQREEGPSAAEIRRQHHEDHLAEYRRIVTSRLGSKLVEIASDVCGTRRDV